MATRFILAAVAAIGLCAPCAAQDTTARIHRVAGEKLDSGLGQLPHYREWKGLWNTGPARVSGRLNPVPGEKLDSGLGEIAVTRAASVPPVAVRTARN